MHALDWLNKLGRILFGAIQPIESLHFCHLVFVLVIGACVTDPLGGYIMGEFVLLLNL